ncbi:hypothetical protein BCR33DRAFT_772031, partial [Rhizoclosmatium globosum]
MITHIPNGFVLLKSFEFDCRGSAFKQSYSSHDSVAKTQAHATDDQLEELNSALHKSRKYFEYVASTLSLIAFGWAVVLVVLQSRNAADIPPILYAPPAIIQIGILLFEYCFLGLYYVNICKPYIQRWNQEDIVNGTVSMIDYRWNLFDCHFVSMQLLRLRYESIDCIDLKVSERLCKE